MLQGDLKNLDAAFVITTVYWSRMSTVTSSPAEVSLFQLINPHLISTDILGQILEINFCLTASTYTRARLIKLFTQNVSPKDQRKSKDNRKGTMVKRLQQAPKRPGPDVRTHVKLLKTGIRDQSCCLLEMEGDTIV
eukprot:GFUD01082381.1.p1 GENE.GFUD01082381.1~~GFUD01082381.1.p1  ORF type:complete len:136 (+),score=28.91 GFUD01082381.1:35-442(+)